MAHDPLCPRAKYENDNPEIWCCEDCDGTPAPWDVPCQCALIAAVRADERAKARQRVEALIEQARQSRDWRYDESYLNGLDDAADAAGGAE